MADNPDQYTIEETKCTKNQTDIYNITWNIPKFRRLMDYEMNDITPNVTVVELPSSKFKLKLRVFGKCNELIEIYYASPTTVFLNFDFEIWFNTKIKEISKDYRTVQSNQWQFCAALNPFSAFKGVYKDSTLTIVFNLAIFLGARVSSLDKPKPQLCDDFVNLLSDFSYSDMTIKSVEGEEFRVHKNILAIRSKVLKAHFEHNTIESTTNIVKTTWETDVLRDILAFIYTDKVPSVDKDPSWTKLLAAAEYYQLQGLKNLCEEELTKRLTVENVIETLQLAELHSANSLKVSTLEFIKDGRTKLITKTEDWKNLSIEIVKIIYEYITAEEVDNNDILATALKYIDE